MIRKLIILVASLAVLSACSGRSLGNKLDDQFIAPAVTAAIKEAHVDLNRPTSVISLTSYNGVVLLVGQTPTAELKQRAMTAAQQVDGVKKVHNEITVEQPITGLIRSNDALLTSKVKARLIGDADAPASRVKVITENGVVYLLGIVDHNQAKYITDAVRHVGGVQKIVRLFEYVD
ncbi:BON domain-containing protein [Thiopseudomonas acetoxidans]|uniref:BON domain-containing protein n=1 Tax=Thiopseudomonas acetoxidans TaxID=3041622 RepID=A0ABT7SLG7_9GAMM|nr:BON domain-containing protein [Thiopseudomonas sp. CY1220]MDM7857034.1 BON domain-containing protein [Thiopseudomonas sp. CY1220]